MPTINFTRISSDLNDYFTSSRKEERAIRIYCKALIIATLLKTIGLWAVSADMFAFYKSTVPGSILGKLLLLPSLLADGHMSVFFPVTCLILGGLIFVKPNYLTNALVCWIVLNLFKLRYPVTNGSDYVLLVMTMLSIPLSLMTFRNAYIQIFANAFYNLFRLMSQIQIAIIYLISAYDKLLSHAWRSGEAIQSVGMLENIFNPWFITPAGNGTVAFLLSWTTILFEFGFAILIWQKRTRLWVLCAGVVFHIFIWLALSLPDFAFLMILTYLVFLKDEDYEFLFRKTKRQPL